MNEIEFLKARLDELEREFEGHDFDYTNHDSGTSFCRHTSHVSGWSSTCPKATHGALIRGQIAAQRKIIEINEEWPILVESEPVFATDLASSAMSMSQQIAWMTNRKYREVFGEEAPTAPVIRALIQPFSSHADFHPSWLDGFERQYLNTWVDNASDAPSPSEVCQRHGTIYPCRHCRNAGDSEWGVE